VTNRLIAGDSLLVMNSLPEKEGMTGKVQMVYIDPPYGIKYGSNFQPFVKELEVKGGNDDDLTQEPEMLRAVRGTWNLDIHSYLSYLPISPYLFPRPCGHHAIPKFWRMTHRHDEDHNEGS
jgi:adenine-specific DNA-methyltransferase